MRLALGCDLCLSTCLLLQQKVCIVKSQMNRVVTLCVPDLCLPACSCSKLGEDGYPSVTPDLRIINLDPLDVGMGREKRGRCLGIPVLVCESLFPKRNSVRVFLSLSETTNQGTFPGMDCHVWKEKKREGGREEVRKWKGRFPNLSIFSCSFQFREDLESWVHNLN